MLQEVTSNKVRLKKCREGEKGERKRRIKIKVKLEKVWFEKRGGSKMLGYKELHRKKNVTENVSEKLTGLRFAEGYI